MQNLTWSRSRDRHEIRILTSCHHVAAAYSHDIQVYPQLFLLCKGTSFPSEGPWMREKTESESGQIINSDFVALSKQWRNTAYDIVAARSNNKAATTLSIPIAQHNDTHTTHQHQHNLQYIIIRVCPSYHSFRLPHVMLRFPEETLLGIRVACEVVQRHPSSLPYVTLDVVWQVLYSEWVRRLSPPRKLKREVQIQQVVEVP